MRIPRAVVFDLDGTLLDTLPDLAASCNHALKRFGHPTLSVDEIGRYVGDGARKLLSRAARLSDNDPRLNPVFDAYIQHYSDHPVDKTQWMPHAVSAIERLSRMPLAICTNKPRAIVDPVLKILGAADRFEMVLGDGDVPNRKPAPDALLCVAERLRVPPSDLVMVGDGPQDVLCGKSVGAWTVAVATGYTASHVLRDLQPDALLDDLEALPDTVLRWSM